MLTNTDICKSKNDLSTTGITITITSPLLQINILNKKVFLLHSAYNTE